MDEPRQIFEMITISVVLCIMLIVAIVIIVSIKFDQREVKKRAQQREEIERAQQREEIERAQAKQREEIERAQQREEIERTQAKQREEIKRAQAYQTKIQEIFNKYFKFKNMILRDMLIIDSNIWMSEKYNKFFVLLKIICEKEKSYMELYGPQFDEICNIKRRKKYGEEKNKRARLAISRIDVFSSNNLLKIKPITIEADKFAYADPLIVHLIALSCKDNEICFVTNDKELRIRVKQIIEEIPDHKEYTLIKMHEIEAMVDDLVKLYNEGFIDKCLSQDISTYAEQSNEIRA